MWVHAGVFSETNILNLILLQILLLNIIVFEVEHGLAYLVNGCVVFVVLGEITSLFILNLHQLSGLEHFHEGAKLRPII